MSRGRRGFANGLVLGLAAALPALAPTGPAHAEGGAATTVQLRVRNSTPPFVGSLSLRVTVAGLAVDLTQDPAARMVAARLTGVAVQDTRPDPAGWILSGQVSDLANGSATVPAKHVGWTPALERLGSDAEGTVQAGPPVAPASGAGLGAPGRLASAAAANGLGTQHVAAAIVVSLPDSTPTGTWTGTLTLTLISQ